MDSTELFDAFREDTLDKATASFWSDSEVFRYMNAAYREFVRLIGGIPDFTSEASEAPIYAGEANGVLHPSVLRVMSAQRRSDSAPIEIINFTDLNKTRVMDYGVQRVLKLDNRTGPVRYGIIGMQRGILRWMLVPEEDDTADLYVKRMPLNKITEFDQEFADLDEDHHIHLLDGMKMFAMAKQDADTFDMGKASDYQAKFEAYARQVKAEAERYEHKNREVTYGGI